MSGPITLTHFPDLVSDWISHCCIFVVFIRMILRCSMHSGVRHRMCTTALITSALMTVPRRGSHDLPAQELAYLPECVLHRNCSLRATRRGMCITASLVSWVWRQTMACVSHSRAGTLTHSFMCMHTRILSMSWYVYIVLMCLCMAWPWLPLYAWETRGIHKHPCVVMRTTACCGIKMSLTTLTAGCASPLHVTPRDGIGIARHSMHRIQLLMCMHMVMFYMCWYDM